MALIPTLAPDPGADIAAQAQLMRQQKLAQLLANPPKVVEIDAGGGGGGGGDKGSSPEGNSILAKALSEDVAKTAGPSVASFDAPASSAASFVAPSSQSSSPVHLGNVNMAERIYNSLRSNGASHAEAIMLTGAANSESSFNPRAIHDGGIGYGMFGHNGRRLAAMRSQFGPNPTAEQQALFALQEARQRGDIPSGASPEQIAAAQMSFERPRGWRPGHPELGDNYGGRLNTIRAYLNRFGGGGSPAPAANPVASAPMAAAPEATPAPYKVASLGYTPVPHRQPIAPMQPSPQPAPAPTATPPVPPIPTMVGAPMPTTSTPISPTAGASLTDAPLPPSRSASGVDDMIKRQAAAARPALSEPEGFDLFDEIGRGLEELFGGGGDTGGGGPSPQQLGTQLASAGEEYYPMPPSNSHGILGLISDAFREPVPIPQEVRALANSPKQSDRLAYQLMVHGDQLGGNQSAMLTALYKEAREREQAGENRFGAPRMDEYGNLVQEGPNGQLHILRAAERPQEPIHVGNTLLDPKTYQPIYTAPKDPPQPPASVQEYEYVKQHPEAAGYFTKTRVPDTENTAEIKNFKYAQQNPEFAKSLQRGPSLTPDAITFYGEQVARGDMSPLQNLGRGAQGAENVTAIRNAAVAFALKNGMDPRAIMEASAGYLGEKAGARTLGTNEANAVNAGVEAMNALQLGRETNAKLPRGQFYPVNKAIQAYQFGTSDPNLAAYGQAVATIANTYARAVNPKGLPHEAVVSDTLRRLNAAQGPDALNAIFDIMQKEIEMAQRAPSQARDVLKSNRGNEGGNTPAASPAANIPPEAIDHLRKEPGLAPQFDEQFGPGSAAKVLGR